MTFEDYNKIVSQYTELIGSLSGIPKQKAVDAQIDFVSKAYVGSSYTMKVNWMVPEGKGIEMDRLIQMHPYDFCVSYAQLTKDWDKALTLLKKYLFEKIDRSTFS